MVGATMSMFFAVETMICDATIMVFVAEMIISSL
jgi:hypothetical protein